VMTLVEAAAKTKPSFEVDGVRVQGQGAVAPPVSTRLLPPSVKCLPPLAYWVSRLAWLRRAESAWLNTAVHALVEAEGD
jgi:hypothetical protein